MAETRRAEPTEERPPNQSGGKHSGEKPPEERARTRALRLLARREKSRRGVGESLARAGFPREVVTGVLDDLERAGVVDDLRFSRLYLGEQARSRPRSVRLMRHDLRREGIAPEVIDRACAEMAEELDESALAAAAARKKIRVAGNDPERLRRLLRARGFGRDAIDGALASVEKKAER
jgi:regulatory protein